MIYYPTTANFVQKTLNSDLLAGVIASASLNNVTSIQNKKGVMIIDRVDTNGNETPSKVEVIAFDGTSGSTVVTLTRGLAGTSDQVHAVGAIVEFGPDIVWAQGLIDSFVAEHNEDGTHSDITADSITLTTGATPTEFSTDGTLAGNSDTAIPTEKAVKTYADGKIANGWIDSTVETWTYASASTFTVPGDQTAKYTKGTRLKFTQTTAKYAVVVNSTYSDPNTTVTIMVNNDYTIANAAISLNYYSYQANPQGYPTWFNITAPVFTITEIDNGSGGQPTVTEYRASVVGSQLTAHIKGSGTKVGAIYYFSMAISPLPTPANTTQATTMGVAHGYVGATDKFGMLVYSSNKLYYIYTANYADNDIITHFSATFQYEI